VFKKKENKPVKVKKERWYSPKGVIQNFKQIHWLPLKSKKDGTDGLLVKFTKVICFMLMFAIAFIVLDALYSVVLTRIGLL
jgi:hypothetical protein